HTGRSARGTGGGRESRGRPPPPPGRCGRAGAGPAARLDRCVRSRARRVGCAMSRSTTTRALQSVLAAEHATVYGYGVAGARLTGAARNRALAAYDHHRASRDEVEARIV